MLNMFMLRVFYQRGKFDRMLRMEFEKPQQYRARVVEKYYLDEGEKFLLIKFGLVEPYEVKFRAGQYLNIKINDQGLRRSYSIVSTPEVDHTVSVLADISPDGVGSRFLKEIEIGDMTELLMPLGRFVVQDQGDKLLFVATGAGIAPIMSMINDLLINRRESRPMRLHWGMRYEKDLFWIDNLERLMTEHDNFVFDLVLSKPNDGWKLCWGRVTDCIERDFMDTQGWSAYLCGGDSMIDDMKKLLKSKGMGEGHIHQERFY